MVDHVAHNGPAHWLVTVNGHIPGWTYNESTDEEVRYCDTCGWIGPSFKGRRRDKADDTWRTHAGDIAMGLVIEHGKHAEVNQRCRCALCAMARRARRTCVELEGHDWPTETPPPGRAEQCARYLCCAVRATGSDAA
jgi:hypothetical protein